MAPIPSPDPLSVGSILPVPAQDRVGGFALSTPRAMGIAPPSPLEIWPARPKPTRRARRMSHLLPLFSLLLCCNAPEPAAAQMAPTYHDLIARWVEGEFRSPVNCQIDGELIRGLRRIRIQSHRDRGRRDEFRIEFVDMEPGTATRCTDDTGRDLPNVLGELELRNLSRPHPDTAKRDFKQSLKRDRGFDFQISNGILRTRTVKLPAEEWKAIDFRKGSASISVIFPATDAQRALAPFHSQRKILLTIVAPTGEKLAFALFDPAAR